MTTTATPVSELSVLASPPDGDDAPCSDSLATSRRAALGMALLAGVWGRRAHAQPAIDAPADVDPSSLLYKLVDRLTFGGTPEEYNRALQLGYDGYLEYHLNHLAIDDSALEATYGAYPTLTASYADIRQIGIGEVVNEMNEVRLLRAINSKRQLFERVMEMWTNHFCIFARENDDTTWLKSADDRDVIRANAMGTFHNMLAASMRSPCMLRYLDNVSSSGNSPNENYAREVMELHTMGADMGYTQGDVENLALILTGWGYNQTSTSPNFGRFVYTASRHSNVPKVLLGVNYPGNQGQAEGDTARAQLLSHPSTAAYIALKICREFLGENVPQSTIADVASVFTATGGDIKAMLRRTLRPERLAAAQRKFKRPMHLIISGIRAAGGVTNTTSFLRSQLTLMGNLPYAWPAPNGYPDSIAYWADNLLPRWNFGASMANNTVTGTAIDLNAFFAGAISADQIIDRINQRFFAGRWPAIEKARVRTFLLPEPVTPSNSATL